MASVAVASGQPVSGAPVTNEFLEVNAGETAVGANVGNSGLLELQTGAAASEAIIGNGAAGLPRASSLHNFAPGADVIALAGFVPTAAANALALQLASNGSTVLHLGNNCTMVLAGFMHANPGLFG